MNRTNGNGHRPEYATAYRLAAIISSEHFDPGELSQLRRWKYEETPPLAYYRLVAEHVPLALRHGDDKWLTLVHLISIMAPIEGEPNSIGHALRDSDFNERRLHRLLSSDLTDLDRVARWLKSKQKHVSVRELFDLVFYGNDRVRRKIAYDYFDQRKENEHE